MTISSVVHHACAMDSGLLSLPGPLDCFPKLVFQTPRRSPSFFETNFLFFIFLKRKTVTFSSVAYGGKNISGIPV